MSGALITKKWEQYCLLACFGKHDQLGAAWLRSKGCLPLLISFSFYDFLSLAPLGGGKRNRHIVSGALTAWGM